MSNLETMAFLHAHGLDVEPKHLAAALREAVEAVGARYYGDAEGLTEDEAAVARSGGLDAEPIPGESDPLLRGVVAYASLLKTGLGTKQAARRLGVTDARVRQRLKEGSLMAMRAGRAWRLPLFQFTRHGELPGWGTVCPHIPSSASPVAVERWLSLPHPDLVAGEDEAPVSPRAWLLEGRPPGAVADLAGELV